MLCRLFASFSPACEGNKYFIDDLTDTVSGMAWDLLTAEQSREMLCVCWIP